ncbi:hypothetical protein, partial [Escherichia coli]|uniref:hypothetical protein n=1 Tax=Escherichia coli TaxID=562 RepID=UPI00307B0F6A
LDDRSILNKVPSEAFRLLGEMAEENRDEGGEVPRQAAATSSTVETKLDKLCNLFDKFITNTGPGPGPGQGQKKAKVCQICAAVTHHTDQCPTLFEEEEVNAVGQNGNGQYEQRRYDLSGI